MIYTEDNLLTHPLTSRLVGLRGPVANLNNIALHKSVHIQFLYNSWRGSSILIQDNSTLGNARWKTIRKTRGNLPYSAPRCETYSVRRQLKQRNNNIPDKLYSLVR